MKKNKNQHIKNFTKFYNLFAGDRFDCQFCKMSNTTDNIQIHHIKFKGRGGGDEMENLIGLCDTCHKLAHGINGKQIEPDIFFEIIKELNH